MDNNQPKLPYCVYFSRAIEARNHGQASDAIRLLETGVAINPDHVAMHYVLATLYRRSDMKLAISHFETVVRLVPDHGRALIQLGKFHAKNHDFEKACAYFETVSQTDLSGTVVNIILHYLCVSDLQPGQRDAAARVFKNLLNQSRLPTNCIRFLGPFLMDEGYTALAETALQRWLTAQPQDKIAVNLLGQLYLVTNSQEKLGRLIDEYGPSLENNGPFLDLQARLAFTRQAFTNAAELACQALMKRFTQPTAKIF